MEINKDMGEAILNAYPEMKVDVHNPDYPLIDLGQCENELRNFYNISSIFFSFFINFHKIYSLLFIISVLIKS